MGTFTTNARTVDDEEEAKGAAIDAIIRSRQAGLDHPKLNQPAHQKKVDSIEAEVRKELNFKQQNKKNGSSNFFRQHRSQLPGTISGPGTVVKLDLSGQRNFTPSDASKLDKHLARIFPGVKIDVGNSNKKPVCLVRIGL